MILVEVCRGWWIICYQWVLKWWKGGGGIIIVRLCEEDRSSILKDLNEGDEEEDRQKISDKE